MLSIVNNILINGLNIGFYDNGKTTEKRGAALRCPTQFFSLDAYDPEAPCYSISREPNVRKNWQVRKTIVVCNLFVFNETCT